MGISDHGHVFPNKDGSRVRCGGPKFCGTCKKDQRIKDKEEHADVDAAIIKEMEHKLSDDIYVPGVIYMSRGRDDFSGGLCQIVKITVDVSAGERVPFVEVCERPGTRYNYKYLLGLQEKLEKIFGRNRGYQDPDYRPEFNRW